jgi:hypothetical protein
MAKPKKPEHIQIGKIEGKITVGKRTNRVHVNLTLSVKQEGRLLRMLEKRKKRRPKK